MTNKPPQQPKTQLSQIFTQAVQTLQAKINFQALQLKPNAQVPELRVQGEGNPTESYPLLGDRYVLGRSSRSCDIVVRNAVVSQVHLSLERDPKRPRSFIIKDENSTNGIYLGRRRLNSLPLRHKDVITLGPPELADSVKLTYHNPPPAWIKTFRYSLYGAGGMVALLLLWIGLEWRKYPIRPLPKGVSGPVVVNADDGSPLRTLNNDSHRELKRLSDFSPYLPDAVVASEDSRYYWHFGVDPIGILRAIVINVQSQGISQGASTITQQVARSIFSEVGRDATAGRKIREMIVALKLETFYSKNEILRLYLNRVYLGVGSYGFEDAARFYFEKSAANLNLSEAATLVAILPAPNSYNPVQDYETAVGLRNRVITRMAGLGLISEEEADRARRSRIQVSDKATEALSSIRAPYFYSHVMSELQALLGRDVAREGNFIIETGLDLRIQEEAEKALRNSVATTGSQLNFEQGAVATLNTRTGEIVAMVGGVDYAQSQFNRAVQAKRQPGSTFKVFAYAAALDRNISPGKTYSCNAVVWQGQRYRGCERSSGNIDMYRGLAQSENAVAIRVAQDVGLNRVISMAERLGISSKLRSSPGLVLGDSEVTVLEMVGAYGAFANNGYWNRPHAIKRILDSSDCEDYNRPETCRVVYAFNSDPNRGEQVISSGIARTMTQLLRGVVQGGTGRGAAIGFGEAGKTGTTDRGVDLWFIGYVPGRNLVTGIWLGNDNNSPTRGSSGQAAQLWRSYMGQVVR